MRCTLACERSAHGIEADPAVLHGLLLLQIGARRDARHCPSRQALPASRPLSSSCSNISAGRRFGVLMRLTLAQIVFLVKPLALLEEIHDVGLRTLVVDLPESKRSLPFA